MIRTLLRIILLVNAVAFVVQKEIRRLRPRFAVGDYVQGVHGGKYQFDDSSGGASFQGQQFAENGYGSNEIVDDGIEEFLANKPNWARRMELPVDDPNECNEAIPKLDLMDGKGTVIIHNDERSWEYFYAVIMSDRDIALPFVVEPIAGMLAPRGGTESHSDRRDIMVSFISDATPLESDGCQFWLVAGTESETWRYEIHFNRLRT